MHQSMTRFLAGMLMLGTILLIWNQTASAALVARERAVELLTTDVPLWQVRVDRLAVRQCPDCALSWLRLDAATRFEVAGTGAVDRQAFLDLASEPAGRRGVITLFLDVSDDYVRRLRLSPRPEN